MSFAPSAGSVSIGMKKQNYRNNQFPDPYVLTDGTAISKPANW
jgi:hypothetical protein